MARSQQQVPLCKNSSVVVVVVAVVFGSVALMAQGAVLDLNAMTYNGEDTAVVGSTVREVRATAPRNIIDLLQDGTKKVFVYTYGDDDGDDKAYHKRSQDDGNSGYKHFDSYHKKDGDKYGYAKHSAYGQAQDDKGDATNHGESYSSDDADAKSNKRKSKKSPKQSTDGTKHTYRVIEEVDDDEGAHYTDGDVELDGYSNAVEGGDDSGAHYTDDGESKSDGESENYEAEAESGEDGGDAAQKEQYEEGGGGDGGSNESEGYANYEDDGESEHYEAEAGDDYY